MLRLEYENILDTIDAAFFSGDEFFEEEALARVEWYIERWRRRSVEIRSFIEED